MKYPQKQTQAQQSDRVQPSSLTFHVSHPFSCSEADLLKVLQDGRWVTAEERDSVGLGVLRIGATMGGGIVTGTYVSASIYGRALQQSIVVQPEFFPPHGIEALLGAFDSVMTSYEA